MCTLWNLALAKKSCNNINNSRAQVSTLLFLVTMDWVSTPASSSRANDKWSLSLTLLILPLWIVQLCLFSMEIKILWNKSFWILYGYCMKPCWSIYLTKKSITFISFHQAQNCCGTWYDAVSEPRCIFHQRVKRGQDATCVLKSYQQIVIRNPYLERNYLAMLAQKTHVPKTFS